MAAAPPSEIRALAAVTAAALLSCCYARLAAGALRPGLPRLAALLPVAALLLALPLALSTVHLRAIAACILAWLSTFKILLLAAGRGPLAAPLPLLRFLACALLPVKLRTAAESRSVPPALVASFLAKAASLSVVVSLYSGCASGAYFLLLNCLHLYLTVEVVLNLTAIAAIAALGMELEPQFDRPYFAASLRDFWGRRWNLAVTAILRPSVYLPVRAALGREAAVLATFAVSGVMHELIFHYATRQLLLAGVAAAAARRRRGSCCSPARHLLLASGRAAARRHAAVAAFTGEEEGRGGEERGERRGE